jgi:hypothetical protein
MQLYCIYILIGRQRPEGEIRLLCRLPQNHRRWFAGGPGIVPKRLLNAGAFMMTGGGVSPSATAACIPGHEPDIDRAAEGLSRAASAAVAGAADAGVRTRHRARRRHLGRDLRARTIAQSGPRIRRGGTAAHRRPGAAGLPPARAVPRRRQFPDPARPDSPLLAATGVAMADPRRCAGPGARIGSGIGCDAGSRNHLQSRTGDPQIPVRRCRCHQQDRRARVRRQPARAGPRRCPPM